MKIALLLSALFCVHALCAADDSEPRGIKRTVTERYDDSESDDEVREAKRALAKWNERHRIKWELMAQEQKDERLKAALLNYDPAMIREAIENGACANLMMPALLDDSDTHVPVVFTATMYDDAETVHMLAAHGARCDIGIGHFYKPLLCFAKSLACAQALVFGGAKPSLEALFEVCKDADFHPDLIDFYAQSEHVDPQQGLKVYLRRKTVFWGLLKALDVGSEWWQEKVFRLSRYADITQPTDSFGANQTLGEILANKSQAKQGILQDNEQRLDVLRGNVELHQDYYFYDPRGPRSLIIAAEHVAPNFQLPNTDEDGNHALLIDAERDVLAYNQHEYDRYRDALACVQSVERWPQEAGYFAVMLALTGRLD